MDDCLGSLARLDYPGDRYEVVLVDNVSNDGSVEIAESHFPEVRVVRNRRNLGFAAGNNVAMRGSRADYIALLNNDTSVDRRWLASLVEAAEQDPRIGACTSKLLFRHERARVGLEATPFRPADSGSSDARVLGVRILDARVAQSEQSRGAEYLEGFYGVEPSPEGPFRWSAPKAILGLPIIREGGEARLQLRVAAPGASKRGAHLALRAGDLTLGDWDVDAAPQQLEVALPQQVIDGATPVIQNAGTLLLRDGSGRDRGAVVRGTEVYQEDDMGQYDRREEVFAGCGAALLLKRTMLEDVGLFDEDFFMYYEDMDLSWRARRRGWKIVYVPEAVVRHVHAGSSLEWSPFFVYHVERSRLLMLGKNAPLGLAGAEHLRYLASAILGLGRCARSVVLRSPDRAALGNRVRTQLLVLAFLVRQLPRTIAKRRELERRDLVPASKLLDWMVTA